MNTVTARVGSAGCIIVALVGAANAQEKKPAQEPASHRMEIYNGPYRTAAYFSEGAAAADQAKLLDAERRENEGAVGDQLHTLLRQYLADESVLQRRRREVQLLYYGHSNVISQWLIGGQVIGAYPYGFGYDIPTIYNGYAPYGYGYAGSGNSYSPGTVTSTNGLFGVGDEGPIKAELIRALGATLIPRGPPPPPPTPK
jgi:hypothetical protein